VSAVRLRLAHSQGRFLRVIVAVVVVVAVAVVFAVVVVAVVGVVVVRRGMTCAAELFSALDRQLWPAGTSLDELQFSALHRAQHRSPGDALGCHRLSGESSGNNNSSSTSSNSPRPGCHWHVVRVWHPRLEPDWEAETGKKVLLQLNALEEPHLRQVPMVRRGPWLYEAVVALPEDWLAAERDPGLVPPGGSLQLPRYSVLLPSSKNNNINNNHNKVSEESCQKEILHDTFGYPGVLLAESELDEWQGGFFPGVADAMGCHCVRAGVVLGLRFAVWAPRAEFVSVVGDWNQWDGRASPMRRRFRALGGGFSGVWELFVPFGASQCSVPFGDKYAYRIHTSHGTDVIRTDPFAQEFEVPNDLNQCPALNASLVSAHDEAYREEPFSWSDQDWLQERDRLGPATEAAWFCSRQPMAIYEVHLPSWRRKESGELLGYRDLAKPLVVAHVKAMNFNYVELIGLAHHPFLGSWGYQVTGFYACFSLLGSPDDLRFLIDSFHAAGIGVIMDFVPAHFCKDPCGFSDFDGLPTFEYDDPKEGEQK
ncbi:unnamed protein product, partial [Polarella glacialis]